MRIKKDAQAVVFRKNNGKIEFLLLKRFDKDKNETHYRLIKGGIEKNETPEETSIRETKEESGLQNLKLKEKINTYSYQVGDVQHDVEVFVVENTRIEDIKVNSENEGGFTIEDAKWVSLEKANECLNFKQEKESIKKSLEIIQKISN